MAQKEMNDTICAVSTPPGVGGIAVVRVSGPHALDVVSKIWQGKDLTSVQSHTAHLGTILSEPASFFAEQSDHVDNQHADIQHADQNSPFRGSGGHPSPFWGQGGLSPVLDQAVATVYRAPNSFTGEDVVELSTHGSAYVQRQLVMALIGAGARMAEAGEFTRRAFAAGKMDLAQAEAVADVIASDSRASHAIAMNQMRGEYSHRLRQLRDQLVDLASLLELELDFSEEDVEFASRSKLMDLAMDVKKQVDGLAASFRTGQAIKEGIPVAIVGPTNAGKSSLLNALLGDDRAIVSDIHGTTRDVVEDTLRIGDYTFRMMDTAGLRDTADAIENMGIERSKQAAAKAQIVLYVIDLTNPQVQPLEDAADQILVYNKTDEATAEQLAIVGSVDGLPSVAVSAKTGAGVDRLKQMMSAAIDRRTGGGATDVMVTNLRHYQALTEASTSITRAIEALQAGLSGDLVAIDIRLTIHHLSTILGDITTDDLLSTIFSRFCIGK